MLLFLLFNWCFITVFREDLITPTCLFCSMEWIQLEISSLLSNFGRSTINRAMKYPLTHQPMKMVENLKLLMWDCAMFIPTSGDWDWKSWYDILKESIELPWRKVENLRTKKHSLCCLCKMATSPLYKVTHIAFCCISLNFVWFNL